MSKLLATSWKEGQQVKRKYIKNMVIAIILLISFKKASASTRDIKMQRGIELWQVMEMAQKNNPALKGRTIEHEKSIIDVEIAKGMASPTIDLWADTTFSNYPLTVVFIREEKSKQEKNPQKRFPKLQRKISRKRNRLFFMM